MVSHHLARGHRLGQRAISQTGECANPPALAQEHRSLNRVRLYAPSSASVRSRYELDRVPSVSVIARVGSNRHHFSNPFQGTPTTFSGVEVSSAPPQPQTRPTRQLPAARPNCQPDRSHLRRADVVGRRRHELRAFRSVAVPVSCRFRSSPAPAKTRPSKCNCTKIGPLLTRVRTAFGAGVYGQVPIEDLRQGLVGAGVLGATFPNPFQKTPVTSQALDANIGTGHSLTI